MEQRRVAIGLRGFNSEHRERVNRNGVNRARSLGRVYCSTLDVTASIFSRWPARVQARWPTSAMISSSVKKSGTGSFRSPIPARVFFLRDSHPGLFSFATGSAGEIAIASMPKSCAIDGRPAIQIDRERTSASRRKLQGGGSF